jgi:glucokinase
MPQDKTKPVLAVDLGGTKIKAAIVLPDGKITHSRNYLTQAKDGCQEVINKVVFAIEETMAKSKLEFTELYGLIIASAGILDIKNGIVTASPSLPGWNNVSLGNILTDILGVQINMINDASAAAVGEHCFGAGKGLKNLIYLTVSTGIGGGIIINGKLYSGIDGCAGELGHMVIEANGPQCNCGNYGCLEILASGSAIAKDAQNRIKSGADSSLNELRIDSISAEKIARAAKQGDKLAREVVNKAAYYLGIGISNIVNIFNPEMVIVGGGVSKMGEIFLGPARKEVEQRAFSLPAQTTSIVSSYLGDDAGIIGAAISLFDN